jgi:hypothetical protein
MDAVIDKPAAWSYSRLHGFEDCPRRWHETDILKNWPKDETPQLKWGNDAHAALAKALKGEPLPTVFKIFQHWVDKVWPHRVNIGRRRLQWAIAAIYPTTWFPTVWLRCMAMRSN